jgi:putative sulfotransferase
MWVERSGNSLEILPHMVRMFPDAKYIHLQRDGIETALSMREHDYFRLYASYFFNPWTEEELDRTELGQQPIGPDDPITHRMRGAGVPTAEQFGLFWSHAVEVAYPELLKMAPGTRLDITYEDLLASPREVLAAIGEFCEFPAEDGWIERAAALLGSPPPARFPKLDPADQAGVHRGCFAGRYLLGQVEQRPWSNDAFASVYDRYERFGVANPFLAAMRERDI